MAALILIPVWLALFTAFLWVIDRVNREFWYTSNCPKLLSFTFYTLGVAGVFLLLGRQNRSPMIARWVKYFLDSKPAENAGRRPDMVSEPPRKKITVNRTDRAHNGGSTPEIQCDILDFVLKKAVTKKADTVCFEDAENELRITYRIGGAVENDKVLAEILRRRVMTALKAKIQRASRMQTPPARGPVLHLQFDGNTGRFKIKTINGEDGQKIILTRKERDMRGSKPGQL